MVVGKMRRVFTFSHKEIISLSTVHRLMETGSLKEEEFIAKELGNNFSDAKEFSRGPIARQS